MKAILVSVAVLAIFTVHSFSIPFSTTKDVWDEVATHREISLPDPLEEVTWRTDVPAALQ